MIRFAYRAAQAREIKEALEAQGYTAVISLVSVTGNHGRAGYRNVRGTLVASPSYQITATKEQPDGLSDAYPHV